MQCRHGEHAVNTFQVFYVADNGLLIDVENRHQIGAQVRDVQAPTIQTLVIEPSSSASQWNIGQYTERQTGRRITLGFCCYWLVRLSIRGWLCVRRGTGNQYRTESDAERNRCKTDEKNGRN